MVSFYFATNRNPIGDPPRDFGKLFSPKGLTDLRFGKATVTGRKLDRYKIEVAPEKLTGRGIDPETGDLSGQKLGSLRIFEAVKQEAIAKKRDILISIHGFNYTFKEALTRTAQLVAFYADRPMIYFLFTWPSDGSMLPFKAYASDRDDAKASGVAFGRGLLKLADFLHGMRPEDYCGQSLHILAHSMGNYVLRNAIQHICAQRGAVGAGATLRRLFDQIILAAADEDDDAFELDHKLRPLPDLARRVTVYCNPSDKALVVSDITKGNPDRLGASGPRNARALPDKVSVVNCEKVAALLDDISSHQYYRLNARVRDDALAVLAGTQPHEIAGRSFVAETKTYWLMR